MANLLRGVLNPLNCNRFNRLCRLNANSVSLIFVRNCGWIRDWKPGPYPKTKEEREAAAKKYNLIPEDYEPYPDGEGYGDYPKLPIVGQDGRDPYDDFDYHYRRRNFGETLHVEYEIYTSDRHNPNLVTRYSPFTMVSSFLAMFAAFALLGWVSDYYDMRCVYPLKPKQYPTPGVVHYTFEPLD